MKRVSRPLFAVVCFALCACCALVLAEVAGQNLPTRWSRWNNWAKRMAPVSALRPLTSKLLTQSSAPSTWAPSSVGTRAVQIFTVNTATDVAPDGACAALPNGDCTLREAIIAANSNANPTDVDRIEFEIPGTAPHTITPATPLPEIDQPVVIDGSTQTGFTGTPLIVLSGQNPGVRPPTTFAAALQITADNSTIRALAINNGFAGGIAIFGDDTNTLASNNKVEGCFFGTNAPGTTASPLNGNAILISGGGIAGNGATNNIIGGTSPAARNIINSNKPNSGYGVLIEGANTIGNRVSGNYIGTNAAGTGAIGNSFGVGIDTGTRGNLIGGPTDTERNIISGNETGVLLYGSSNTVQGNYIGTTQTGNAPLPNANVGVSLDAGASGNVIGGVATTPGTGRGNVISGNTGGVGVEIIGRSFGTGVFSNNNRVQGNLIGVQDDGSGALANRLGVVIKQNAFNNPIGGANAGEGNVIAHNAHEGVTIADNSTGNAIRSNNIFSNGGLGIDLGANGVTINDAGNDGDTGPNNLQNFPVITSVTQNGSSTIINARLNTAPGDYTIDLFSNTARDNTSGNVEGQTYLTSQPITVHASGIRDFSFTRPGTISDFFSMTATRNAAPFDTSEFSVGVRAPQIFEVNSTAGDVDTGGCQVLTTSTDCTLREAIEAANRNIGADIINFEIPGTGVRTISVNPALPIITGPVVIDGSSQSGFTGTPLIFLSGASITGGADGMRLNASNSTIKNLAIGNFTGSGINIGFNQTGNKVEGCFIGTNAAGTEAAPNGTGIQLSSVGHTIGGVLTGQGNLISGNRGRGISDVGDGNVTTVGNTILANTVGLNLGRSAPIPNNEGIVISSRFKTVVGSLTFGGNFISGNTRTGISVTGNFNATTPDGIVIEDNEIGGNAANDFGNGGDGVFIGGRGCLVYSNTIVGNTGNGINLFLATQNSIQRNDIGLPGVGNDGVGVFLNNGAKNNVIGGTAADIDPVPEGNLITANGGGGVHVFSNSNGDAIGNTIRGNTIKGNVGLGIDLRKTIPIEATEAANKPTPNDAGDPDTGNNNLQNFPVITGVNGRTVNFTFNSRPNTNFVLDFYSNAGLDASLHGEGETRIGSLRFTTNDSGNSPVTSFTAAADLTGFVTATATNVTTGDTSEFSAGRRVVAGPPSLSIRNITAHEGNTGTTNAVFTVTLSAASTQPVRVDFLTRNGTATAPADYTALPVTTIVIPAGSTTATITVAVKGDTIDEPDETFFIKITASSNATIADGDAFALIIDDDTSGSCSAPPTGLVAWYPAEGNANDIAGNNEGTATTDVTYPTAKVGKGFDFVDGSVRVPDASSLRPTTITAEAWVAATAPGFKYILAKSLDGGRATYAFYTSGGGLRFYVKTTVAGNGGPGAGDVWLSPGASSAIWDGNPHHIAGTFDGSTVRLFVDGVQVGNGTATQGTLIYGNTYQNGDLIIGNYNPTGSFAWPGVIDEMSLYNRALSPNEIQAIFNAGNAGKCRPGSTLSINDVAVTEGNTGTANAVFTVTLSAASTQTVTVNFATANGTTNPATAGSDYTLTNGTLTFTPGQTSKTISVPVIGDTMVESNETFFVNLSAPTNATITKARGIGTITDDDGSNCTAPGIVAWYRAEGDAQDSAGNHDGALLNGATFTPGVAGRAFKLDGVDDYIQVPHSPALDPTAEASLAAWVNFSETPGKAGRTMQIIAKSGAGRDLDLQAQSDNKFYFFAGPGAPNFAVSNTVIQPGRWYHIVGTYKANDRIEIYVNGVKENTRLIPGVTRQANGNPLTIGENFTFRGRLFNGLIDEAQLYTRLLTTTEVRSVYDSGLSGGCQVPLNGLSINDVTATEGNSNTTNATFTVRLAPASTGTVSVKFTTSNGSATTPADYGAVSSTLTFAPGQTSKTISVPVVGDTVVEPNETFFVTLFAPTNAGIVDNQGRGTIVNDDNVQAGSLQFSSPTYSVSESGPVATLSVTRTGGTGVAVGVSYAITNGTAVAPGDYTTKTGTLSWAVSDSAAKTITVPIIDDALVEGNETFSVTLSAPTGGAIIGTPNRAVVTISNNDSPPPANGGPLILMGIDAEDGGLGSHGPIDNYVAVVNSILGKVANGGQGILVIGGGKSATDDVTEFWNEIAADTGKPVTYVNGATNITARSFAGFAMIAIVSSAAGTPSGGLTQAENDALATRRTDVATFVNTGGGLLGFSQSGLATLYPYIEGFGVFTFKTGLSYSDITPTPAGQAIGITDALDVIAWHDEYLTFPAFLGILATNAASGKPAAIGGAAVVVGRGDALLGWGYNDYGSVGDGTRFHRPSPVTVNVIQSARLIASGGSHNLAVSGNTLYAWGDNESGQLGDGTRTTRLEPVVITLPTGIRADGLKAIACGWYHSLAITADNRVLAWGLNQDGQCGVAPDAPRFVTAPRIVAGLADITQISGGTYHSLALDSSRRLWAWGNNFYGQLGNGTIENVKHTPAVVKNLPPVQSIGAGGGHTIGAGGGHSVALLADGTARAWGWNLYGQLGDGLSGYTNDGQERRLALPVVVKNVSGGTQLGVGYVHNLVRKSDGAVLSWGNNFYGQLGRSTTQTNAPLAAPVVIGSAAFNKVQSMAVGTGHNLVIDTDGTIWSWGYNEFGSLGRGTTGAGQTVPQQVPGLSAARAVAAGYGHSLAIARRTTTGTLVAQRPTEFVTGTSWASSNSITLTFSAKLNSIAPDGVRVLVNDKEVAVQSTSVSGTTLNVLLPNGTLQKGDEIIVAWSGLQTQSGELLQGNSSEIIAE